MKNKKMPKAAKILITAIVLICVVIGIIMAYNGLKRYTEYINDNIRYSNTAEE